MIGCVFFPFSFHFFPDVIGTPCILTARPMFQGCLEIGTYVGPEPQAEQSCTIFSVEDLMLWCYRMYLDVMILPWIFLTCGLELELNGKTGKRAWVGWCFLGVLTDGSKRIHQNGSWPHRAHYFVDEGHQLHAVTSTSQIACWYHIVQQIAADSSR